MPQSFRVLLVEDDDSLRACLGEFLASQGWEVGATAFAGEALTMFQRRRYDFSILDFNLPGTTGLRLFQQLATVRPLPAILMSGLASTEEISAAQHAGFFAFLRKPLELERLRQSLELLIQSHFGGPLTAIQGSTKPKAQAPSSSNGADTPGPARRKAGSVGAERPAGKPSRRGITRNRPMPPPPGC